MTRETMGLKVRICMARSNKGLGCNDKSALPSVLGDYITHGKAMHEDTRRAWDIPCDQRMHFCMSDRVHEGLPAKSSVPNEDTAPSRRRSLCIDTGC